MSTKAAVAARQAKALELALAGYSEAAIAKELSVTDRSVRTYLSDARERLLEESRQSAEAMRAEAAARIREIRRSHWPRREDPAYASVLIRLEERFAKMFGLDAPTKLEHMLDPSAVQSVLGFALSGALSGFAEIRDAVVSLGKVGEVVLELIDHVQGGYVSEFEQRARTELQAPSEAA